MSHVKLVCCSTVRWGNINESCQTHTSAHSAAAYDALHTLYAALISQVLARTAMSVTWLINVWDMSDVKHDSWECHDSKMFGNWQHTATHCNTLQHTATHCNTLQHTATHCNTLRHRCGACLSYCNTLQHTATHWCSETDPRTLRHMTHGSARPNQSCIFPYR